MVTMDKLAKSKNENTIYDKFLENICNAKKLAKIYLCNGICLQGYIEFFDEAVLILRVKEQQQLIYKYSVATIMLNYDNCNSTNKIYS